MTVKQKATRILCGVFVIMVLCVSGFASASDLEFVPCRYSKTRSIKASLSITAGIANRRGTLTESFGRKMVNLSTPQLL